MNICIILALAICGTSALPTDLEAKWVNFKTTFNRNYATPEEEAFRKQIFQKKVEEIEEHNAKYQQGLVSFSRSINQFADTTPEETIVSLGEPKATKPLFEIRSRKDLGLPNNYRRPESFDWRDQGVITPIRNQEQCGCCYAYSAGAALEAQYRITQGADLNISISTQNFVDCVKTTPGGCVGGWMTDVFDYIALDNHGADSEDSYPYEAEEKTCRFDPDGVVARLTGHGDLSVIDEDLLADMVITYGPVTVAINELEDFLTYSGGIYYNPTCVTDSFQHAVVVIGYGTEDEQDYWLVKNSWGTTWGIDGFGKMARNKENNCGIASKASVPVL